MRARLGTRADWHSTALRTPLRSDGAFNHIATSHPAPATDESVSVRCGRLPGYFGMSEDNRKDRSGRRVSSTKRRPPTFAGSRAVQAAVSVSIRRSLRCPCIRAPAALAEERRADGRDPRQGRRRVFGGERVRIDAALSAVEDWRPQEVDFDLVMLTALIIVGRWPCRAPGASNPDGTLVNSLLYASPSTRSQRASCTASTRTRRSAVRRALWKPPPRWCSSLRREMGREYLAVVEVPVRARSLTLPSIATPQPVCAWRSCVKAGRRSPLRVLSRFQRHALIACALETGEHTRSVSTSQWLPACEGIVSTEREVVATFTDAALSASSSRASGARPFMLSAAS